MPTDPTPDAELDGLAGPTDLRRLLDAVVIIGSDLELSAVLQRIVENAAALVNADYGALGVLDESRSVLNQFITVGIDLDARAAIGELPRGHGILGRLIVDPVPLRLPNLAEHPDSCGFPPNHPPMSSFLGVPVLIRGEAYGNLYLCDKAGSEPFTDVDEELVVALAAAAGVAIEHARLHSRLADVVRMEDRDRIARDLHDTVIQRVFAIGLSLEGASRLSTEPVAIQRIQSAVDDLDTTIKEIRSAIFELNSARPSDPSTRQAAIELASELAGTLGFEPAVRLDGPIDTVVPEHVAGHLLAVQREALSNAARHADASSVVVSITASGERVTLEVTDDGVGIDDPASDVRDHDGLGVGNMSSRAAELGGDFGLTRREGGGTVVRWSVPLR